MGFKVLKLHGCSGAGKTTVARAIFSYSQEVTEVSNDKGKPEAYACRLPGYTVPVFVLGSYKSNCGGMDTVSSAAEAIKLVHDYHEMGHVFHEGLLQSTYYGAMGVDAEQFGEDYIYAFLDTPLLVCLERVTHRRDVQQTKRKFNPQLTIDKYNTIERLKKKLEANNQRVYIFRYDSDPIAQINTLFNTGN